MITFVTIIHLIACSLLILLVLLQQGKGADVGATFGGGSNTLFGAAGADTLLTRLTTGLAICFMLTSVYLARGARDASTLQGSVFSDLPAKSTSKVSSPPSAPTEHNEVKSNVPGNDASENAGKDKDATLRVMESNNTNPPTSTATTPQENTTAQNEAPTSSSGSNSGDQKSK